MIINIRRNTRTLILIYDSRILAIMYMIWNRVGPPDPDMSTGYNQDTLVMASLSFPSMHTRIMGAYIYCRLICDWGQLEVNSKGLQKTMHHRSINLSLQRSKQQGTVEAIRKRNGRQLPKNPIFPSTNPAFSN